VGGFRFFALRLFNLSRRTSLLSVFGFVVLLLSDFLGVRDVTWVSHQLIDGSERPAGRISR